MKSKVKAIARTLLLVLVAAVIGFGIYSINAERLTGNTLPMPFGFGCAVVLSGSMEPALSVGDLIWVVPSEGYCVDDVVVYQDGRSLVVHRILRFEEDAVVTMGDANDGEDEPISADAIKGKVVFTVPLAGYLVNVIKKPVGILVILGLAIFLMERSFAKKKRAGQDQLDQIRQEIERLKQEQNTQENNQEK